MTPTILQMEAVECGAAALGIILSYYGRIVPLAELRRECGVSRDGSKASSLLKAARNYGLKAKGFKKDLTALKQLRPPYIVFWNFNHFLVVEGFGKDRVYLNDPGTGPRSISFQEFDEAYTGVTLVLEPGPDFRRGGHKPSMVSALATRLQGSMGAIAYCILAGFLLVLPGLAIPTFTQVFIDDILIQGRQDWFRPLLLGLLITAILRGVLTALRLYFLRRLQIKLSVTLTSQFLWHLLQLPINFYTQRYAGEIVNRIALNDKIATVLSGRLATTAIDVVMVVFYALVMAWYDRTLTLIAILFAGLNLLALQQLARLRTDANRQLVLEYGKVGGVAISGLQSIETLKASALESDFFARWAGYYTKALNAQQNLGLQTQTLGVLPTFLSAIASLLLLTLGGFQVMRGNLTIGMLIAFQSLMVSFLEPVNRLVSLGSVLQELESELERLDDVLANPTDPAVLTATDQPMPLTLLQYPSPRLNGAVELRHIYFGHNPVEDPLLQDFNLKLAPGQRIALVGGSGSGKSTLARIIAGLYQPWSGEVYFDGQPRSQIPRWVLTNSLAFVEQDILLFEGTVRDNLTLWDATISEAQIVQACRDAIVHDVIMNLPGDYDALLLEGGVNLSGGQRQRLEIARALVGNPSILVMDEATSALDTETEAQLDFNLRYRGCTCIIVAHRLSTIRDCDQIIVLDRGQVVQQGNHESLIGVDGIYQQLIRQEEQ